MKLLLTSLIISYFFNIQANSEIRNGYAKTLEEAEKCIENLNFIDTKTLDNEKKIFLRQQIKKAEKKLIRIKMLYRKTNQLINTLYAIHPKLFFQIDTIKDKEGNNTDVYIKAVDETFFKGQYLGTTNLNQSRENPNIYTSSFGDKTVCVSVVYKFLRQSLKYLVHELGHVKYQVPHLAEYVAYFNKMYNTHYIKDKNMFIGHASSDPSHRSVKKTEKEFYKVLVVYHKNKKYNKNIASENKVNNNFL